MHFGAFKATPELSSLRFVNGSEFIPSGDACSTYTEHFHTEVGDVALTWEPLSDVFMAELPKEKSATGKHEMFSLFVNAEDAHNRCAKVAGHPVPRDMVVQGK